MTFSTNDDSEAGRRPWVEPREPSTLSLWGPCLKTSRKFLRTAGTLSWLGESPHPQASFATIPKQDFVLEGAHWGLFTLPQLWAEFLTDWSSQQVYLMPAQYRTRGIGVLDVKTKSILLIAHQQNCTSDLLVFTYFNHQND